MFTKTHNIHQFVHVSKYLIHDLWRGDLNGDEALLHYLHANLRLECMRRGKIGNPTHDCKPTVAHWSLVAQSGTRWIWPFHCQTICWVYFDEPDIAVLWISFQIFQEITYNFTFSYLLRDQIFFRLRIRIERDFRMHRSRWGRRTLL